MKPLHQAWLTIVIGTLVLLVLSYPLEYSIDEFLMGYHEEQLEDAIQELVDDLPGIPISQWDKRLDAIEEEHKVSLYVEPAGVYEHEWLDGEVEWTNEPPEVRTVHDLEAETKLNSLKHRLNETELYWNEPDFYEDDMALLAVPIPDTDWELLVTAPNYAFWPAIAVSFVLTFGAFIALVSLALNPLKNQNGRLLKTLHNAGVETDEKSLPDTLADEFTQLHQQLQTGHEQWRDLLHGVAHEIRSPLARISFAISEWKATEADQQEERDELENLMDRAIGDLDKLAHEVLRYSRLELMERGQLALEQTSLEDVVDACCQRLQPVYPAVHITVEGERPFVVNADAGQLERAIMNLMRNGARYSQGKLHVFWTRDTKEWRLTIEDDGPGIPPGKRARIFEPFTRLDPSRSRDSGGNGLGLAIVKAIVSNHNATVSVDDSPLGGARFTLVFPLVN